MILNSEHRESLYEKYASSFKDNSGRFDSANADSWEPCFQYYARNWLPNDLDAHIIDLGCGDGRLLYLLAKAGYRNVEGVDLSDSQVEIARQISDRVSKTDALEYLTNSTELFDLILGFDVIEHLTKVELLRFLELCRARLKPGGRVIFRTPNASSPFFGEMRYGDLTHEIGLTPNLLSQLVAREGFFDIECRENSPVPKGYSYKSTIRFVLWQIVRLFYGLLNLIETGSHSDRILTRVFLLSARTGSQKSNPPAGVQ